MANEIPGGVRFRMFEAPQAQGDIIIPTAVAGGGAATEGVARALDRFSQSAGRLADAADMDRGLREGAQAGFDPEFRRREGNSVYARAFNRAGTQVYQARLETDAMQQFEALSQEFGHDPAALSDALSGFVAEQLDSPALTQDPLLRAEYVAMAQRTRLPYERRAARASLEAERESQLAETNAWVSTRLTALDRLAMDAGLDGTADAALAGEMESLERRLVMMGPQEAFSFAGREYDASEDRGGLLSPVEIERTLRNASAVVAEGRVLGAFSRVDGLQGQRAFLSQFREDVAANEGFYADLDRNAVTRMENAMARDISRSETALEAARRDIERGLERALSDASDVADAGLSPGQNRFEQIALRAEAIGSPELAAEAREAGLISASTEVAAALPPAILQASINEERARLEGREASPFEARRLTALERTLGEMNSALAADPLSWAVRAGVADIPPLQWTDEAGEPSIGILSQSLAARGSAAEAVAANYGVAPRYFTEEEAETLAVQARTGNVSRLAIARAVVDGLGEDAPAALSEIAPNDTLLGHIGGLVSSGADRAARDAETGLALSEAEGFVSRVPARASAVNGGRTLAEYQSRLLGEFAQTQPRTAAAALVAAEHIYNARATARHVTEFDGELYGEAVNAALGAVEQADARGNVVRYGGLSDYTNAQGVFGMGARTTTVVAPNWLQADRLEDVVADLTPEDIAALPAAPVDARGETLTPREIRRMRLLSEAPGRYILVLGEPGSDAAEMAMTPGGEPFVLDLDALRERISARHPDWVR